MNRHNNKQLITHRAKKHIKTVTNKGSSDRLKAHTGVKTQQHGFTEM